MSEYKKQLWREWLRAAGIRAVKTWAQAFLACVPMTNATLGDVNWAVAISTATLAAIISLAMSTAGLPEADSPMWED